MTDTNQRLIDAVNAAADADGNVTIEVTFAGEGHIHTGKSIGDTFAENAKLTVPLATATAHVVRGWAKPVAAKPKKREG